MENWTGMTLWCVILAVMGCAAILTNPQTAHVQAAPAPQVPEGIARARRNSTRTNAPALRRQFNWVPDSEQNPADDSPQQDR